MPNALDPGVTSGPLIDLFSSISEEAGTELSSVPLASPASGVIYTNNPTLNVPVPSNETLGPILTQRAETIGRHKIYVAATYQFFRFEDIDGLSMKGLPIFLATVSPVKAYIPTNNRLDLTSSQVTAYLTFGLTSAIDVSVAVPILNVHEQLTTSGTEYSVTGTTVVPFHLNPVLEGATGVGDLVFAAKGTLWKSSHGGGGAFGTEVHVPTGDAANYLGAGTIGVKPFVSWTFGGRFSPHANFSYQMNGESILATNVLGAKGHLANRLFYSGGADWRITPWMTLAGDALAQRVFKGPRLEETSVVSTNPGITALSLVPATVSYNRIDGSFGAKFKPFSNLIITANLLVKLDQGGLRARTVPLGGLSFTF